MRRHFTVVVILALLAVLWPTLAIAQARGARPAQGPSTPTDLGAGKRVFDAQCAWCHGTDGEGGTGPNLRGTLRHATDVASIVDIITSGIPGTEMPSFRSTERSARQTAAYVRSLSRAAARPTPGDAGRGAGVYESSNCGTCHVVSGRGGILGPELTSIGARRGPPYLRDAIVKPEATHPTGYLVVRAVTTDGTTVRGIRANEDVFWIHIRDVGGTVHVLEKAKLTTLERELTSTLMPSYATRLTGPQLDDIVAYLTSLRGAK